MINNKLSESLIKKGQQLFNAEIGFVKFTNNPRADELINDLENHPHAFVLACIMDRQIKAELAWVIPYHISDKLGNFRFNTLAKLDHQQVEDLMTVPDPLHRFPHEMATNFFMAIQKISEHYSGLASNIWSGGLPSAEVVYRFLDFRGVGQKIGTMATNILARDFKVKFSDYYSIDISVDSHIKRVFKRIGLAPKNATNEQIIYRARALSPEFPGLLDLPLWEIGRNWCKPSNPDCTNCLLGHECPRRI